MADRASFVTFIRHEGINSTVLPDNSMDIDTALALSIELVSDQLSQVSTIAYNDAVYNLGLHFIIELAADVSPTVIYKDNLPYFAYWRSTWKINSFTPGVLSASADEGTSMSLNVPEFMNRLTMGDLQFVKTPWGRRYMTWAQRIGSSWGITF